MTDKIRKLLDCAKTISDYCSERERCSGCIFSDGNCCILDKENVTYWSEYIDTMIANDTMNIRVADAATSLALGMIENGMDTDQAIERTMGVLSPVISNRAVIQNELRSTLKYVHK